MFNKLIFYRFFFRKNQDSTSDWKLPFLFTSIVAFSSMLIVISSKQLHSSQAEKDSYLNNPWNHVYELYVKNSSNSEFMDFKTESESSGIMSFEKFWDNSPMMVEITAGDRSIPKLPLHVISRSDTNTIKALGDTFPIETITDGHLFGTENCIFLNKELMKKLNVKENDLVLLASNIEGAFTIPLSVREIKSSTRIKAYIFENYFNDDKDAYHRIRYFFNNELSAFKFIFNELYRNWKGPYYIGIGRMSFHDNFLAIHDKGKITERPSEENNYNYGKFDTGHMLDYNSLSNMYSENSFSILDSIKIYLDTPCEGVKITTFPLSDMKEILSLDSTQFKLNWDIGKNMLYEPKNDIDDAGNECWEYTIKDVDFFNKPPDNGFYIEIDFRKIYSKDSKIYQVRDKQSYFFDHLEYTNDIQTMFKKKPLEYTRKKPTSYFAHYKSFKDNDLNIKTMNKIDQLNIRWDNARFSTIIDLNESLEKGYTNLMILIIANFIVFFLILTLKFILRFKLELHSIGVLKCFGYSRNVIFTTYNLGNVLTIIIGFIIGTFILAPISHAITEPDTSLLISYYVSEYIVYPLLFLSLITISSILTTTGFLYKFTEKENIYELIKYES